MLVSNDDILSRVTCFIPRCDILFLLRCDASQSTDIDLYCVSKAGNSEVHMFVDAGRVWNELFIDNLSDTRLKISVCDEICVNFLTTMEFVFGEMAAWESLKNECLALKREYKMTTMKKFLAGYRIKCLFSKLSDGDNPDLQEQDRFIVSALTYPLIQLVFDSHGIFPESPKRWILQLRKKLTSKQFSELNCLFDKKADRRSLIGLIDTYCPPLVDFHRKIDHPNSKTSLDVL